MDVAARARQLALAGIEVRATQADAGGGGGGVTAHEPAGSPKGGQFTSRPGGGGSKATHRRPKKAAAAAPQSAPQAPATPRLVKEGDSGEDVRYAQYAMSLLGFNVAQDGRFGPETAAAVKQMQQRLGMKHPNGHITPALLHKMQDAVRLSPCVGGQRDLSFEAQWEQRDDDLDDDFDFDETTEAVLDAIDEFERSTGAEWAERAAHDVSKELRIPGGKGGGRWTKNPVTSAIAHALEEWAKGNGPDDPFVFDGKPIYREPLRKAAVARGISLKRGASREDIVAALKADLKVKVADAKAAKSPDAGKPVRFTLTGGGDGKPDALAAFSNTDHIDMVDALRRASERDQWNRNSGYQISSSNGTLTPTEQALVDAGFAEIVADEHGLNGKPYLRATPAGTAYVAEHGSPRTTPSGHRYELRPHPGGGYNLVHVTPAGDEIKMRSFFARDKKRADEIATALSATENPKSPAGTKPDSKLRNLDVGVFHEPSGKLSLWEVSDSGERRKRVALVDDLAGLESWANERGESELAGWARKERGATGDGLDDLHVSALGDLAREHGIDAPNPARESDRESLLKKLRSAGITAPADETGPAKPTGPRKLDDADVALLQGATKPAGLRRSPETTGAGRQRNGRIDDLRREGYVKKEVGSDHYSLTDKGREEWARKERGGAEVPKAPDIEVENAIRAAYRKHGKDGDYVGLAEIRAELGTKYNRADVDAALKRLAVEPESGANIVPQSNQKALTPADHAAALHIGGQDRHFIHFEDSSPRTGEADVPKAPTKRAPAKKATKAAPTAAPDVNALRTLDTESRRDALDLRKVDELKAMLREQGLPVSGRKRDLVDRLVGHLEGGGKPVAKVSAPTRAAGRDISRDHDTMAAIYNANIDEDGAWIESPIGDLALAGVARQQGFDALPTVLSGSEFDRAVAESGHAVMYRGVDPASFWGEGKWQKRSGADVHAQLREGDYQPGYGVFGNGYYFATDKQKAESFSDGKPGSLGRYALAADARVIDYEDLRREYGDWFDSDWSSASVETQGVTGDFGRYAASKGYDAIRVPVGTRIPGGGTVQREEWVVLNRGTLIADRGQT